MGRSYAFCVCSFSDRCGCWLRRISFAGVNRTVVGMNPTGLTGVESGEFAYGAVRHLLFPPAGHSSPGQGPWDWKMPPLIGMVVSKTQIFMRGSQWSLGWTAPTCRSFPAGRHVGLRESGDMSHAVPKRAAWTPCDTYPFPFVPDQISQKGALFQWRGAAFGTVDWTPDHRETLAAGSTKPFALRRKRSGGPSQQKSR